MEERSEKCLKNRNVLRFYLKQVALRMSTPKALIHRKQRNKNLCVRLLIIGKFYVKEKSY